MGAGCARAALELIVEPVNDPPTADDTTATTREDTTTTKNVLAATNDIDGDPLSVTSATPLGSGSVTITPTDQIRYTPLPDASGTEVVRYRVSDGHGGVVTALLTITIGAVNDPPSFTAGADELVNEDAGPQSVPGWATAISPGPPDESAQTVGFNVVADTPALFSSQPAVNAAGDLTYTPAPDANGTATLTITAQDDGGTANGGDDTSAPQNADIVITAQPDPPVLDPIGPVSGFELSPITFTATASDADGDGYGFTLENGPGLVPPGAAIDPGTGAFSWTPTEAQDGVWTFDVVVTDDSPGLLTDRETITVTAIEVPDALPSTMALGGDHTCRALADATMRCTGLNSAGQLGLGNFTSQVTTQPVLSASGPGLLTGVVEIGAGANHTCAVLADETVYCWGSNADGQLGNGDVATVENRPTRVSGPGGPGALRNVVSIDAGFAHTCALTTTGTVYCWGKNNQGQVGSGAYLPDPITTPRQVVGPGGSGFLTNVADIAVAGTHTCAVRTDTTVWCWGNNAAGRLGIGVTGGSQTAPTQVVGIDGVGLLSGATSASGSDKHSCARLSSGRAVCWGSNSTGQLGELVPGGNRPFPVSVVGPGGIGLLTDVSSLNTGKDFTCAGQTSGLMKCWGLDGTGQLGNGALPTSPWPGNVAGPGGIGNLTGVIAIFDGSGSNSHACAQRSDLSHWCWGDNLSGQLGDGANGPRDAPVPHS